MSTVFLVLSVVCFAAITRICSAEDALVQVQMIVRHGARTPLERTYPTDPYQNYSYAPYDLEQLTLDGKKEGYYIGQQLRQRYMQFVKGGFRENVVYLTADDGPRVRETALALAAGLWPPLANETLESQLIWQPLHYNILILQPPYSEDDGEDNQYKSKEFLNAIRKYEKYIEYINENAGTKKLNDLQYVYSSLSSQEHFSLKLPQWTKTVYPDILRNISGILLVSPAFDPEQRASICGTARNMVAALRDTVTNKTLKSAPLSIFTGHDDNIAVAVRCFGVDFDQYQVLYVGNIALELYDRPYYGVKVLWQAGLKHKPIYLQVKGCNALLCPFDKFLELFEKSSR